MGETQQYCLKWNNYQTSLSSSFKDLLANEKFVDCTLTCGLAGGQTIHAHRVVLSACSPYFRQVLSNLSQWQHPVIILKDIKYEELSGIVEFIYHGEVSIDQECLPGFLQAAESLRIKGLTEDKKEKPKDMYEEKTSVSSSNQTTLIHKALKKLMNGAAVRPSVVPEDADEQQMLTVDNNNEDMTETDNGHGGGADPEEEEEALSESEIPMSGVDFQTMYRSFMSGSVSEDSDGSKDVMAGSQEDGQPLNINFGDANSPLSGGKKTCPYCYQQLSWHALSRHIRDMHKAKSDTLVTCKYCLKTFRNKNSLGCHIWRFHKRGKELIGAQAPLPALAAGPSPSLMMKSEQQIDS